MAVSGQKGDLNQSGLAVSVEENEFHCDPCERDGHFLPAEGYCVDCEEFLCSLCYKYHRRPVVWRHHCLQDKMSMPKVKSGRKVSDVCREVCPKHANKIVEYFCKTHKDFGCSACITTGHRACEKVDYIPEVAATFGTSEDLKDLQTSLTELFERNERNKSKIDRNSKAVSIQAERAKLQVKSLRSKVDKLFDDLEKKIDKEISTLKSDDENQMKELAKKLEMISQELQNHIAEIERGLNKREMCRLFISSKHVKTSVNDLTREVSSIEESGNIQRYQFTPDPTIMELISKIKKLGTIDMMDQKAKVSKFQGEINIRAMSEEKECNITGITLMSEQMLVVVDSSNNSVKLIDIVSHDVTSIYKAKGTDLFTRPFDVTKINVGLIAVTYPYGKRIQCLSVSKSGGIKMNSDVNVNGTCFGIACVEDNLVVTFRRPSNVKILKMTGIVIRTIFKEEGYLDYVAVNPYQNMVYITKWNSQNLPLVTCMTVEGKTKAVFEDEELNGAHGAYVDNRGVVYVCFKFSEKVLQLSESCTIIQEILGKGDDIKYPSCITLSERNNKMYIGMETDNVKVFQLY